jgi:hypothetical protein
MLRILIADGTPAAMQAERETFGIPSNASLFEAALRSQQPHIGCSSINVADGQDLPGGVSLGDFDGLMFSGSPLHIYDRTLEVTRQIDFAPGTTEPDRHDHIYGRTACGQPSGPVSVCDSELQPPPWQLDRRGGNGDPAGDEGAPPAALDRCTGSRTTLDAQGGPR